MQTSLPIWIVMNHSVEMGTVAAVSYKQAQKRARAKFPHRRLQIEGPINVRLTESDRIAQNRSVIQTRNVVR